MLRDQVPADALPYPVFCRGVLKNGKRCRKLLVKIERGIPVYRGRDVVIVDVPSITCSCGYHRSFRGGVPEELGGSSGVIVRGELRSARSAA